MSGKGLDLIRMDGHPFGVETVQTYCLTVAHPGAAEVGTVPTANPVEASLHYSRTFMKGWLGRYPAGSG